MNRESGKEITGWWLSFTTEEARRVESVLEKLEYEKSPTGLREYILDTMEDDEERERRRVQDEGISSQIAEFLKENPDIVSLYANLGKNALNMAAAAVLKRITKARSVSGQPGR
jgi:hypothetical protein